MLVAAIPGFTIADAEDLPGVVQLYLVCTAAISLAVVIGFASLLPGGAGIRELVVTTVLAVSLGATHAILAAIAARVIFAVVEGFVALICWLCFGHHHCSSFNKQSFSSLPPFQLLRVAR